MLNRKQARIELAEAAREGINSYLKSTRGAQFFGHAASVIVIPKSGTVQVQCRDNNELVFFELSVKNPWS